MCLRHANDPLLQPEVNPTFSGFTTESESYSFRTSSKQGTQLIRIYNVVKNKKRFILNSMGSKSWGLAKNVTI